MPDSDSDNSDKKQPWLVPVVVAVVGAISTVAVAWISKPPSQTTTSPSSPSSQVSSNPAVSPVATSKAETYTLQADSSTGIALSVSKSETLRITASGKVSTHPNGGTECDSRTEPGGLEKCAYINQVPSLSWLPFKALIGEFNGKRVLIGSDRTMTFDTNSTLVLKVNDWIYGDNAGSFEISVVRK